jgi:MYXO-CTERM domain-containing protein
MNTRSLRIEVLAVQERTGVAARRRLGAVALSEVTVPGLRPPAPRRSGFFATTCGELRATGGAGSVPLRVSAGIAELDAGSPLRLQSCGGRLPLPRWRTVMRADHLLLRSPAPRPLATAAVSSRVTSVTEGGAPGQIGSARLQLGGPGWLVLTQSWSRGWRAWCRDAGGEERELGEPVPIDGYANGWRVGRGCTEARFAFAPQTTATASFAVSGAAALGLLALVLLPLLRRRRADHALAPAAAGTGNGRPLTEGWADQLIRLGWLPALLVSGAIGALGALLFALRMGPALAALSLVLLLAGLNVRRLVALAAVLIAVLPVIYVAFPPVDRGGFSFTYPTDVLFAHWVAVLAVTCLGAAAALACLRQRRASAGSGDGAAARGRAADGHPEQQRREHELEH